MSHPDSVAPHPAESRPAPSRDVLVPVGQLVLAAIGIYVAVESVSLDLWTTLGPGPGLLPLVLGASLAGLTAVWTVQSVLERRAQSANQATDTAAVEPAQAAVEEAEDDAKPIALESDKLDRPYLLGVVGGLLLLAGVMEIIGFQIAMAVFLFVELTLLGRQRWWISAAVALVGSVGVFVLFDRVLAVQLPLSSIPLLSNLGL